MHNFALILGFILIFSSAAYPESDWKIVSTSFFAETIAGFLDASNGITAGQGGEVHYTGDGGKSWPQGRNSSMCRFGLEILDETNAWTCGNGMSTGDVRFSRDGGRTWTESAGFGQPEPNQCRFLSFCDPLTGWIASLSRLAMTSDGAKSWQELKLPRGILDNIVAVSLLSKTQGYVLNQEGSLFMTKDAGKNWSEIPVDMKGRESFPGFLLPLYPVAAMRFQNENQGTIVILTTSPEKEWQVLQTIDGGKTWRSESLPPGVSDLTGSVYLSPDGKFITISDSKNSRTYLLSK